MNASAYAQSGVNIDAGERFVQMIKERIAEAWPYDKTGIGGFAGSVGLSMLASRIVGCSDGSGTVAIVAALAERPEVIGNNAAAMSAVDAYVSGAFPVALLDVIDVAKLVPERHIGIIDGLIAACKNAGACRLIGGETAELPDMFRHDWMVNVNTSVIAIPDKTIVNGRVCPGHRVWGWRSEGPASNGFSLIRKIFGLNERPSRAVKRLNRYESELRGTLADALLRPAPVWINQIETQRQVTGVSFAAHAHITGGGLVDNIPRVLPDNCKVVLDRSRWQRPPIFPLIQQMGKIDSDEMDRVFNQGLMVVSIIDPDGSEPNTPNIMPIGTVEKRADGEPQVQFVGEFSS